MDSGFQILYEQGPCLVVGKPPGLATQAPPGIDSLEVLYQVLRVVKDFKPLTAAETAALLDRTTQAAATGKYELFKTSNHFDGTARHPEWLG